MAKKSIIARDLKRQKMIKKYEEQGKNFERLASLEGMKTMLFGAVYDKYCIENDVPAGVGYISEIQQYESDVLSKR